MSETEKRLRIYRALTTNPGRKQRIDEVLVALRKYGAWRDGRQGMSWQALESTYYEPFVNGLGLKRGEYLRVIPRIGGRMRNKRKA